MSNLWSKIWSLHVPEKIKLFLWKVFHKWLLTNARLAYLLLLNNDLCTFCASESETIDHLLFDCSFSSQLWSRLGLALNLDLSNRVDWAFGSWLLGPSDSTFKSLVAITSWFIWHAQNSVKHRARQLSVASYISQILAFASNHGVFSEGFSPSLSKPPSAIQWSPLSLGSFKFNCDGSWTPDAAGIEVVIRDSNSHCLQVVASPCVADSAQVTEALAIHRIVLLAKDLQVSTAIFECDCKTLINYFTSNDGIPGMSLLLIAVVTGANKGIGLATARQLALNGVTVVLTARDENRGTDAVESLRRSDGLANVVFHQLDVRDEASVASLAEFIRTEFGKLDILVNNAGASGVSVDVEGLKALNIDPSSWLAGKATNLVQGVIQQTLDGAMTCFDTNYYGCKRVTEALLPLLKLSTSAARIVNVSSLRSELRRMPNERIRDELNDIDNLNEEKIERLLNEFLEDLKNGRLEANGWPMMLPSYSVSKTVLNAYTRVLAKRHPDMHINCVHPGYVNTDINWNTGVITTEEGAKGPVMLALLPEDGPTGCYFDQTRKADQF
ncbi:(+)-neomenthol dehydrogenase [Canna indica]|uniref:(+)-neomenthol dehydrogenase n=1 Tax=Canna indica TaxID=4628 RepID=A0AAQ3K4Q9_9LILI|nr:(+)-neomenthol dehydrogenase [Canna indica]